MIVSYILLTTLVTFSVFAVISKDLLCAVIFLSASSMAVAFLFYILQAPDIAVTKAAVDTGIMTIIYVVAIQKTRRREDE